MWVMSSMRFPGGPGNPPYVEFRIGRLLVATITMENIAGSWEHRLRLMRSDYTYEIRGPFRRFGDALKEMHHLLRSPPPEGFSTGSIFAKNKEPD